MLSQLTLSVWVCAPLPSGPRKPNSLPCPARQLLVENFCFPETESGRRSPIAKVNQFVILYDIARSSWVSERESCMITGSLSFIYRASCSLFLVFCRKGARGYLVLMSSGTLSSLSPWRKRLRDLLNNNVKIQGLIFYFIFKDPKEEKSWNFFPSTIQEVNVFLSLRYNSQFTICFLQTFICIIIRSE